MNILNKLKRYKVGKLLDIGFHGDLYLIEIIDQLINNSEVNNFIETGTNLGSTLSYFSKKYPHISCYSCEPNKYSYRKAIKHLQNQKNVKIYNCLSSEFWGKILDEYPTSHQGRALFWLDSHGYGFTWPLIEEINYVLKNWEECFILIDDFRVPNSPQFKYDEYDGQICSYEYIKNSLIEENFSLYYPNYTEKTSKHHPLKGWGLIIKTKNLNLTKINNLTTITKAK